MTGKTILLVEDDKNLQEFNKHLLEEQGFTVQTAMTLAEARKILDSRSQNNGIAPDVIVLDVGMPDGSGREFLREYRPELKTPALFLTGYNKDADIIRGYESGGDDYLTKPYTFDVLLAKIKRLLQKAGQVPDIIRLGLLSLDVLSGQAFVNGADLLLTKKEFALLLLFAQHEGRTIGADYLYEKVWRLPLIDDANAVRIKVSGLRKKLSGSGYVISTTRGEGYYFEREQ